MECRLATINDLDGIMHVIQDAIVALKNDRVDQWQDGYPNQEVIQNDIYDNHCYVVEENNEIIASAFICAMDDETYDYIEDGDWLLNDRYVVIHRIAVRSLFKGKHASDELLLRAMMIARSHHAKSIRMDTHKDNLRMQGFLKKHGFVYCGKIYLNDGSMRYAYEKSLLETQVM